MKLREYLSAQEIRHADFASQIGVTGEAVRLWLTGARLPSGDSMQRILDVTGGQVQPNDFFDVRATQ